MSNAVAEPVAPAPSETQTPGATPPAPAPQPSIDTFLTDSAKALPDALAGMLPPPTPVGKRPSTAPVIPAPPTPTTQPSVQPAQEAQPVAPVAPASTAPAESQPATPEAGAQPTEPPQTAEDFTKNWRIKAADAKQALFLELIKNGIHPTEATREVYGDQRTEQPAPTQPAAPAAPQPNPVEQADQQISALAHQLAELSAQIDDAAEKGDTVAAIKLTRQENDLKSSLQRAKDNREAVRHQIESDRVNAEVNSFQQHVQGSIEAIMARYPFLSDKTGDRRAQFNAKVLQLEKDPRFGPDFRQKIAGWPEMVAQMAAEEHGWSRQAPAAQPPATPRPATAQPAPTMIQPARPAQPVAPAAPNPLRVTSAEVVSPSANPGGTAPQLGIDSFMVDSATAKPEELFGLLAKAPLHPKILDMIRRDPRQRQLAAQLVGSR